VCGEWSCVGWDGVECVMRICVQICREKQYKCYADFVYARLFVFFADTELWAMSG
jgi:hypothetical protein